MDESARKLKRTGSIKKTDAGEIKLVGCDSQERSVHSIHCHPRNVKKVTPG